MQAETEIQTGIHIYLVAGMALCGLVLCSCKPSNEAPIQVAAHDGPSVVLITLDTTRADHLGCYGYNKPTSPRIDRFAEDAVLFENGICTAAVTPVSHASIMTGLYPYTHGLRVLHGLMENRLPDEAVTLAEILKQAGYRTAAFISAFPAGKRFGLHQGFDTFNEDFLHGTLDKIISPDGAVNTGSNQRRAGDTTVPALQWVENVDQPYFLWLHYFDPHDPKLLPPQAFLDAYPEPQGSLAEKLRAIYDIEIRYMDYHIGRVFDALEAAGRFDDTIIVIVSDHGEGLGDHNWWTHGILYDEQIRAPLIIHAPGVRSGASVSHLVRTIDVMPTILELVGLDLQQIPQTQGRSLVPMLRSDTPDPGYVAYADSVNMLTYGVAEGIADVKDDMLFSVTDGQWKYIHHLVRKDESELYDLVEDPRELHNLYESRPEQVKRFIDDLKTRDFLPDMQHMYGKMSDEDIKRLETLGYINK